MYTMPLAVDSSKRNAGGVAAAQPCSKYPSAPVHTKAQAVASITSSTTPRTKKKKKKTTMKKTNQTNTRGGGHTQTNSHRQ